MGFTPEQIKGRIKSVAKQNNADARTLMRIYMMERFLERLAQSEYRDNFIIKGGIYSMSPRPRPWHTSLAWMTLTVAL